MLAFIVAVSRRGSSTRPRKLGMILFIRIFKTAVVPSLIEAYPLAARRESFLGEQARYYACILISDAY